MGGVGALRGQSETVYLGLGSNLGDRGANLRRALELVSRSVTLERVSSIYETEPWGYAEQPSFLNCACAGGTALGPRALLEAVKDVERALGRQPSFPNGPRTVDVDILFYGRRVISEPGLDVPHPRMAERGFVLVPLVEIGRGYVHPVLKLTVEELLHGMGVPEGVKVWAAPIPVPGLP